MIDKESLARRVEPLSKEFAWMIREKDSQVQRVDTPFFKRGDIYLVIYLGKYRPVGFTVGCVEPDFTVLLPNNPDGFMQLAKKAEVQLDDVNNRLRYITTFLETTRDFSRRFQIIRSFNEIELVPKPTPEEAQRYEQLKAKYGPVIKAPTMSDLPPWEVQLWALKEQNLVTYKAKLFPDGKVEIAESVVERDLPIAFQI